MAELRVECRTSNPGKPGETKIPTSKFDTVRVAFLSALADGDVAFADLPGRIEACSSGDQLVRIGSLGWHVTTGKPEMETGADITRLAANGRQILTLKF